MNKLISIISIIFGLLSVGFTQKEVLTFSISKPEDNIEILTVDSTFKQGEKNLFKIINKGTQKILNVEVFQGKLFKPPGNVYQVQFDKPGQTYIKVYVESVKGVKKVGLIKKYSIEPLPEARLLVCGVSNGNPLDLKHLVETRSVSAEMIKNDFDYKPTVMSFKMVLGNDTLKINGSTIPFEFKKKLHDAQAGQTLEILESRVMLPTSNKNIVILPYLSVFLIDTDQYSVGTRKQPIDGILKD